MNPEEATPQDQEFATQLAAYDEALAAGRLAATPSPADSNSEVEPRLERCLELLPLLRGLRPSQRNDADKASAFADIPLDLLGRFQIRRELGRGAHGIVFLAYDPKLRREVALKIPRAETLFTPSARERFLREARAAAGLEHPNLVPVHDAGEEGTVCFIAYAYCPGITLAAWCKQQSDPVPVCEAAALVATSANAVHHAHLHGIIHRDLKPGNILLRTNFTAEYSEKLIPKITDFGLAKLVDGEGEPALQTQSGVIVGTPSYMAPEQAGGKNKAIGLAADIYALGAILYELLTGRPPFQADTSLDTLLLVRTEEPIPPSRLRPKMPRDLETICLKCLQKEPAKRYASASVLADDLRRFLAGQPIQARPIRVWERGLKWARRRPAIAGLLASIILVTALGFAGVFWQWREAATARETLQTNLYYKLIALAEREFKRGTGSRADELLDQCPPQLRGWEWHYLKRLPFADFPALAHDTIVARVAFSPDGLHLASGELNGNVTVWDARTGTKLHTLRAAHDYQVLALAFSPDGSRLASGGRQDRRVRVWDVSNGKLLHTLPGHTNSIEGLVFSPDGKRLASASVDHTVRLWDLTSGQEIFTFREHVQPLAANGLAFCAGGQRLISVSVDGVVRVWDAATGQTISTFHGGVQWVWCAAFSPNGGWFAMGGQDGIVKIYQTEPWKEVRTLEAHSSVVLYLAVSPDGRRLASTGEDRTLKVWDVTTGHEALLLDLHAGRITSLAFSPDGHRLASGSADKTVEVFDGTPWVAGASDWPITWTAHQHKVVEVAFSPDSQRLVSASWDKTVKLWDVRTGQELLRVPDMPAGLTGVAFSRDGRRFAAASLEGRITICDAQRGKKICTLRGKAGPVYGVAFNPVSNVLASAHSDGTVNVWDIERGRADEANPPVLTIPAHSSAVLAVAYSADGRLLASAGGRDQEHSVGVWEAATGKTIHRLPYLGLVWSVAFSPDGGHLACAGGRRVGVVLWDVETGHELRRTTSGDRIFRVIFSPNGRRLVTACEGQTVRLLDATGQELDSLRVSGGELWGVAFSPNGRYLATCSGYKGKGTIQIWDAKIWDKSIVRSP